MKAEYTDNNFKRHGCFVYVLCPEYITIQFCVMYNGFTYIEEANMAAELSSVSHKKCCGHQSEKPFMRHPS
jgi:hypothetical protein